MDRKQKLSKPLLALILVSVLFIPAVFIYMAMKKDADQEALQAELQHEIASLEGSLLELNEMNEHSGRAKERAEINAELKKQQLEEMAFKLNSLEDKVAQMAKDNQANEALIKELKEKLAKAKSALVDNYKKEIDLLFTDNVHLSQIGDSLREEIFLMDSLCRMEEKDLGLKPVPSTNLDVYKRQAKKIARQEWNKWNLDAVYPMNYNDFYLEKPEWVGEMVAEGVEAVEGKRPLFSGLFICPNPENKTEENDPENHGLLPKEIETAIRTSMENGAAGICLFTPDRMTPAHWEAFDKAIHIDYSAKN